LVPKDSRRDAIVNDVHFTLVAIGGNPMIDSAQINRRFTTWPWSLRPIGKNRMQGPFANHLQNCINGQEKLICGLD
jgi:hypothetical protein